MNGSLASLFTLYTFTTGRAHFGLRAVGRAAEAQGFTELRAHCDAALAHIDVTRALERRWTTEPTNRGTNPAAAARAPLLDAAVGALRDAAVAQTKGAAPDDPIFAEVSGFLAKALPNGVHAITSLPYVEKLAAIDDLLELLQGPLAADVQGLAVGRVATRLAERAEEFREALEAPPASVLAFDRVRAARARCQSMLLGAVCIIVGKHHEDTEAGTADRLALLAPILEQNAAIGAYLRERLAVRDVDPETGVEEEAGDKAGSRPKE